LRVIEHHKSGGLHIHFLTNEFIPWPTVKAAWGRRGAHGAPRVKFARFYRSAAAQRGGLERVASYVAKELLGAAMYSAKEAGEVGPGAHGYEVAQGYGVESIEFGAATLDEACRIIQREFRRLLGVPRMKRRPRQFWSGENRDWCGPPMVWASGLLAA
jgi:hypothetical protein